MSPLPWPCLLRHPCAGLPPVRVLARPEDFVVEELALYEPCGTGTHTYFWIEKRGLTSHEAARRMARALGKRPADAGMAGLKDARAITRQWICFEHVDAEKAEHLDLGPGLRVLRVSRHGNKLRMGHLKGNRFTVRAQIDSQISNHEPMNQGTLPPILNSRALANSFFPSPLPASGEGPGVGLPGREGVDQQTTSSTSAAAAAFRTALEELARRGVPNYFGLQRFGRDGGNTELGRLLVLGDEAGFRTALQARGQPPAQARDRKFRNLMVNAFQAGLFNRVLARRMPNLGLLHPGDLALLHRNGAVFAVTDGPAVAREQPRCDAFEISPSGPLYGPKMPWPEGEPGTWEREVLTASGVSVEDFGRREAERQPGARRPLRVPFLEPPRVEEIAEGLRLYFALPSGSYATVVLRELVGEEKTDEPADE